MSDTTAIRRPLPTGSIDGHASGWWTMIFILLSEGALFAYLLFSYYYFAIQPHAGPWPEGEMPSLKLALPNTIVLLVSSLTVWMGQRAYKRGSRSNAALCLALTIVLGTIFIVVQGFEWSSKTYSLSSSPYGSLYYLITGFHMAHVVVGLIILAAMLLWSLLGYFDRERHAPVEIGALYWHFVDAVWLAVFFTFYITPYLR